MATKTNAGRKKAVTTKSRKVERTRAAKKGTNAKKARYPGGVLKLDKKNLRVLNSILSAVDPNAVGSSEDDAVAVTKMQNKVRKEYQKYQKSLPKDQRTPTL